MAAEAELERLIVRISADTTQLVAGLQKGTEALQSLATKATSALRVVAGFIGIKASFSGLRGLAASAEAAELKLKQLEIAIRINGGAVEQVIERYKEFAAQVAKSTTMTKGETLSLLKRAEVMGFSGKEAEAVVKNSIALSGALGGEASEHMRMAVQLARGNFHLAARILGVRGVKNETELLAQVEKQLNAGLEMANAAGQTNEASIARLGKTFDSVKIKIGGIIAEGLHPFLDALEDLQTEYQNVEGQSKSTWENARSHVKSWAEGGIFAIKNFQVVLADMQNMTALKLSQMGDALEYFRKTEVPKALNWLRDNSPFGKLFDPAKVAGPEAAKDSGLTRILQEQADKSAQDLMKAFDKYQIENKAKFEKKGRGLGRAAGEGIGKGIQESIHFEKIEATLGFSLEGIQKATSFFATGRIGESKADKHHNESMQENRKQTDVLKDIRTNTGGPGADLGGGGG